MTRFIKFANNATSRLASNLSALGTTISVVPGDGDKFPALTTGQFLMLTLVKADGTKEVVKVTAKATDTMTIVRSFEAVGGVQTAFPFSAGDKVELRLTADSLSGELDRLDAAAFLNTVTKTANYTITEADVCSLIKADTTAGNITITLPQISTLTASFEVQVNKSTGDANTVTVTRSGTDTINGLNTYALSAQYQCVWLVADLVANVWTAITSASASNKAADSFVGAGSSGPFTLSGDPGSKNNTDVFVGGVYQQKSTYTLSGTSLTLGGSVGVGVSVEVLWSQPLAIGVPSDGTVTTDKLAAGAVTLAKTTGIAASGANTDITSLSALTTPIKEIRQIQPISASVAASALTISSSALSLDFRSTTLGSGAVTTVTGTPSSLVVPSTATLGTVSAVQSRLVVLALNNAGTIELAVVNIAGGNDLTETGLISTTAISAAATSASVVYSTTARTSVAYRVIGYIESTQATAGTWATAPATIQGFGGQALAAMSSLGYGQTITTPSRSLATTYYNTSGKPIFVTAQTILVASPALTLTVNGVVVSYSVINTPTVAVADVSGIVPVGGSYSVTGTTLNGWTELR